MVLYLIFMLISNQGNIFLDDAQLFFIEHFPTCFFFLEKCNYFVTNCVEVLLPFFLHISLGTIVEHTLTAPKSAHLELKKHFPSRTISIMYKPDYIHIVTAAIDIWNRHHELVHSRLSLWKKNQQQQQQPTGFV